MIACSTREFFVSGGIFNERFIAERKFNLSGADIVANAKHCPEVCEEAD